MSRKSLAKKLFAGALLAGSIFAASAPAVVTGASATYFHSGKVAPQTYFHS